MALKNLMVATLCVQLVACAGPQFGRTGPAVALPNGAPRNACEREDWYEIAPARVRATGATAGLLGTTYYSQVVNGRAVFRRGEGEPESVEELWPSMREPALQRKHQAHIDPVDAASERTILWSIGGLAVGFTGVGIAAAVEDRNRTAATAAGVIGVAALIVGVVGALSSQPSGEEQLHADARRKLFIEGEDGWSAVERGVNNVNSARRHQCGGTPAPSPAPEPVPAPAPAPTPSSPASDDTSPSEPAERAQTGPGPQ